MSAGAQVLVSLDILDGTVVVGVLGARFVTLISRS